MRRRIGFMALAALLLLSFFACQQPLSVSTAETERGSGQGSGDGCEPENGPGPTLPPASPENHFFFLPPLAPFPDYSGTFAFGLEPVVRISLEKYAGLETLVEFSTGGSGAERVRLESSEALGDYYIVNFHLKRFDIPPHSKLLIEVLVEGQVLGALRAITVGYGSHRCWEPFERRVPLFYNRTVPIKFRIEEECFGPKSGRIEAWLSVGAPQELLAIPAGDDFVAVAAGSLHAVALRADGSLVSWGRDSDGSVANTPAGTGFVAVDAGLLYSLALHEDGTIYSWGGGLAGSAASKPTGTGFTDIAAGYAFALALTPAGGLSAWSLDADMLLTVPAETGFVEIKVGQLLAVALDAESHPRLFGISTSGVIGASVPPGEYQAVDAGVYHAAGILSDGSLVSWGGTAAETYGLALTLNDGPYVAVAAGQRLGVGIRANGTLRSYGDSPNGAVITPTSGAEYFAVAVSPADSVFAIRRVSE
jgi:hypothetical protein